MGQKGPKLRVLYKKKVGQVVEKKGKIWSKVQKTVKISKNGVQFDRRK